MWVFEHRELTVGLVFSAVLFFPFYMALRTDRFRIESTANVTLFFLVWGAALTAEYFILGPNSFIAVDSDSRNIAFLHFLARLHDGSQFAHGIAGGQDLGFVLPGTQPLMPERELLSVLDPWVVIWLHKALIGTLGFFGSYLLARHIAGNVDRFAAVGAAAIFPVSHIYLGNYSIEFGTGFAAIPLAVYAAVTCVHRKSFLIWVLGAGIILAMAQPMKVFPAALIATLGGLLLYKDRHVGKSAAAFAFFIALSVLNWYEILHGMAFLVDETARVSGPSGGSLGVSETLTRLAGLLYGGGFPHNAFIALLIGISAAVLIVRRDRLAWASVGVPVLFSVSFVFVEMFPWQIIGLGFLNHFAAHYMWLSMPVLAVPIAARAVSTGGDGRHRRQAAALLAAALSLLVWNKVLNAAWFAALGGQASAFGFKELKLPNWKTEPNVRVITLFETPPTNLAATYYGLDSFDGAMLLNPKPWNDYWTSIRRLPLPTGRIPTRSSVDWTHWNGKAYAIGDQLRLELLAIANVKYLISALPLTGDGLEPVVTPPRGAWAKTRPGFFPNRADYFAKRLARVFDPGRLFVYALSGTLPRVFAATGIETVGDDLDTAALHDRVAAVAPSRRAVVAERHASKLTAPGTLRVVSFKKVMDGYDVRVRAPDGGTLMINNSFLPYWQASAVGRTLSVVPANGIHMAVAVPPGAVRVEIRYRRPTAVDQLASFFR